MGEKFKLATVFSRKLILWGWNCSFIVLLQINEHGDPPFFICYLDILSILSYLYIYIILPGITLDMKWNAPRRLSIISYQTRARGIIEFHCIKNSNTYWLLHDGKLSSGSSVQSFLFLEFPFELALYTYFYDWKGRYLEMIIIFVLQFLFFNIFFNFFKRSQLIFKPWYFLYDRF